MITPAPITTPPKRTTAGPSAAARPHATAITINQLQVQFELVSAPCAAINSPSPIPSVRAGRSAHSAFTLIEVVLAIAISIGMLGLILYFYQQAAHAREQIVAEVEKISAARLLLDKITQDLRCARPDEILKQGLRGESNSVQFLKTEFPDFPPARPSGEPGPALIDSDLHLVSYSILSDTNTASSILSRSEIPYLGELIRTNLSAVADLSDTAETNLPNQSISVPITDQVHFLQLRYWDGTNWVFSWNSPVLPSGVEVSLGMEPLPEGVTSDEYPYPVYRRTIFVPGSAIGAPKPQSLSDTNESSDAFQPSPPPAYQK